MRQEMGIWPLIRYQECRIIILGFLSMFPQSILAQNTRSCSGMDFRCGNGGLCISRHRICDGTADCPNQSDETNCQRLQDCFTESGYNMFKCNNGKCISSELVCDGINDCTIKRDNDTSDEMYCASSNRQMKCGGREWKCANGKCIPKRYYCDNDDDCGDLSDQPYGCRREYPCIGKFSCGSGQCISPSLKCNGVSNCEDGSDESASAGCRTSTEASPCDTEENQILCKAGNSCINSSHFCDKTADCPDRSDEFSGCDQTVQNCAQCTLGCRVLLYPIPKTICNCPPGYILSLLNMNNCDDVDECREFGRCSQICTNLPGTFECSCHAGFEIMNDNRSCELINATVSLILVSQSGIEVLPMEDHEESYPLLQNQGSLTSVTYNAREDYVYWTGRMESGEGIWRSRLDGSEFEAVVNTGVILSEGIAYDWIGNNFYFTSSDSYQIVVCSANLELCAILSDQRMYSPRDLALNPNQGFLFWTTWGSQPGIGRSGMDGSSAVIIQSNILKPTGIAVDHGNGRVYWTDASTDRIETVNYDGTDRHVIRSGSAEIMHPFGVEVFGDMVLWSDQNIHEIKACSKLDGSNITTLLKEPYKQIRGFVVFTQANQPVTRENSCKNTECSHICVLGIANSYRCLCPVGMVLVGNTTNCTDVSGLPKVLIGYNNTLKVMRFNSIGRDVFDEHVLEDAGVIGALVYNPMNDTIILSDLEQKKIYEFDSRSNTLTVLIEDDLESVLGMDIDVVGDNLYWVDSVKKTIEVMSFRTGARAVLFKEIESPVNIIVIPDLRFMILATSLSNGGFEIVRLAMNGAKRFPIVRSSKGELLECNYHRESRRIFWTDAESDSIKSVSIDGGSPSSFASNQSSPIGITSYQNQIYWTEKHSNLLRSKRKESEIEDRPIFFGQYSQNRLNSLALYPTARNLLAKVTIIERDLQFADELINIHQCSSTSAHRALCSHICLMSSEGIMGVCVCPREFRMGKNGQTCKQDNSNRNEIPIGCVDGQCPQVLTTDPTILPSSTPQPKTTSTTGSSTQFVSSAMTSTEPPKSTIDVKDFKTSKKSSVGLDSTTQSNLNTDPQAVSETSPVEKSIIGGDDSSNQVQHSTSHESHSLWIFISLTNTLCMLGIFGLLALLAAWMYIKTKPKRRGSHEGMDLLEFK